MNFDGLNFIKTENECCVPMAEPHLYSKLFIMLYHTDVTNYSCIQCISKLAELLPSTIIRPYCLLIYIKSSIETMENDNYLKKILQLTWRKKFLDFSVIEVKVNNSPPVLHYYNPFYDTFSKFNLTTEVKIFPNKLQNVNGYSFRMLAFHHPPEMNFTKKNLNGKIENIIYYPLILIAIKIMNFTTTFIADSYDELHLASGIQSIKKHFKNDDVNALLFPAPITFKISNTISMPIEYLFASYSVIVPVISISKFSILVQIFTLIMLVTFIALVNTFILRLFKIKSHLLQPLNIAEVLLGMSLEKKPNKLWEQIIFSSNTIIYGSYFALFYSMIVGTNYDSKEIAFDTFEEIDEYKLQPYINNGTFRQIFSDVDEGSLANIKAKTIQMDKALKCRNIAEETLDFVCIVYHANIRFGQILVDGRSRVSTLEIGTQSMTYILERSSPYVNKLQYVFRKIYESGIWQCSPGLKEFTIGHTLPIRSEPKMKNILLTEMLIFYWIGLIISCIILFMELIVDWFKKKRF